MTSSDTPPATLEKFLDARHCWLFLWFAVSADLASSACLGKPLVQLSIDDFGRYVTLGQLVVFLALQAIILLLAFALRNLFLGVALTIKRFTAGIRFLHDRSEPRDDYKNHKVSSASIREYAIIHNNGVLHSIYQECNREDTKRAWIFVFQFLIGFALLAFPMFETTSLHVLIFHPLDISPWSIAILAALLIANGVFDYRWTHQIFVGNNAAKRIEPERHKDWRDRLDR
jgi:hypothetical protein